MGRLVMKKVSVFVATVLFLGTSSVESAGASPPVAEGPTQTQLEHMVSAMKTCRTETSTIISAIEQDAKERKNGPALYHVDGPKNVQVVVDKVTFSDFYLASCYQRMLAEDPVMQDQTFVSDGSPIT